MLAESFLPETSSKISVPSGTSSSNSMFCVNTKPGASSESTNVIFGSK